jgi:hypothetical protein
MAHSRLGQALAFVILLLGFGLSAQARADEAISCVQRALHERGYDPGAIDGVMGPATLAAATTVARADTLDLAPLSTATAPSWCAVLATAPALPEAGATGGPLDRYRNTDPGALPLGIWFHSSVATEHRKLIVDDLAWLQGLGSLQRGDRLAALLGLPIDLSGADLVAWLVRNVALISEVDLCPESTLQLWSWGRDPGREAALASVNQPDCAQGFDPEAVFGWATEAGATIFEDHTLYAELHQFDDHLLLYPLVAEPAADQNVPAVMLNFDRLADDARSALHQRMVRLSTLFHEAFHIASGQDHVDCQAGGFAEADITTSFVDLSGRVITDDDCDSGFASYALESLILEVFAASCDCSFDQRLDAIILALGYWDFVQIPLVTPSVLPPNPLLGDARPRKFASLPPEPYFEQLRWFGEVTAADCQAAGGTCASMTAWRDDMAELARWAEELAASGGFSAPWRVPRGTATPIDSVAAGNWLKLARGAAKRGYNVPLIWIPACAQFGADCTAVLSVPMTEKEPFDARDPLHVLNALNRAGAAAYLTLDTYDDPFIVMTGNGYGHVVIFDGCGGDGKCEDAWLLDKTRPANSLSAAAARAWDRDHTAKVSFADDGVPMLRRDLKESERASAGQLDAVVAEWLEARLAFRDYANGKG